MKAHCLLITLLIGVSLRTARSQTPSLSNEPTDRVAASELPATRLRQSRVPDRGFWVVETQPGPKRLVIVHYYNANQLECQTDTLEQHRLSLTRRRVTARLNTRLSAVLNQSDRLVLARP